MAALRELLLAAERDLQPLDDAILSFSRSLLLSPPDESNDASQCTAESASSLRLQFLTHGAGNRWERRESFATFLHVVTHLLQTQQQQDATQAEAFALRVVREKTSQLEKLLSWSDKPLIEFRALELLAAVAKVSGAAARELVRLFNFQCPAFVKLATRRWKKPEVEGEEVKQAPFQLRAAYADLGGVTASLFKSMDGDSVEMLTIIFNRLGELVLHNKEVEHKSKLVVFNATCVHQLLALLQVEDDESVRDTALGVLNALFFEDSALYVVPQKQALRLFLAKSASNLHGEEEATTSERLTLSRSSFLSEYPGFLSEYLAALSVQLEPKPMYRWFCVASLVQKLLSCSLDAVATGLPTTKNEDALSSWCSAQSVASRLIAPGNYRKELSRCIQHTNNLVIYSSLGVIEATLKRYVQLASVLESLGLASEVQSELRFLLPSPEALVSLLLKLCASQERKIALIYVRALTVFRLYLECLPQTMREVKVDFTKTLTWRYLDSAANDSAEDSLPRPMQSLIVGEMLRFLLAVDTPRLRFLFTSGNSGNRSKLQQMLLLYVSTPSQAVQELAGKVLQRTLLASDIYGHETQRADGRANEEVAFWLESLRQSGSKFCAEFTERLARAVMADPLMYVAVGRRVVTEASSSSSLSPITVALVGFLNSRDGAGKPDLSAYRADPCVVTYAVRILLALKQTSKYPQQLVDLIASKDAFTLDMAASKSQQEENDENSSDDSNGKKRKRSVGSDEPGREDAYVWLKNHCEALVSGKPASSIAVIPKKKARASSNKWHRFSDPSSLTAALVAMTPSEFTSSWGNIVSNCADIADSFGPVLHYLSARADVDILSLLTLPPAAKNKKQTPKSAAAEAFTKIVPVSIVLQHILFSIASKEAKEQDSMISTVVDMIKRRVKAQQLAATEAARMCEQLLFFFSSSRPGFLETGHTQLCELFLQLLTIVLVSDGTASTSIVTRIFFKLQAVITSTSNAALWRQLSAVEIVALRVYSSKSLDTDLAALCDIGGLFQRAGVPLVAVLASRIPTSVRLPVLDSLLHQRKGMGKQYNFVADYKRATLLTRKLWQLLASQSSERQLSFFTTGFAVLSHLGGVDAATAVSSMQNFIVPLVMRSEQTASSCTEVLRGIIAAIQGDKEASVFPVVLEDQLSMLLRREKNERVKCELMTAIYNVFTRVGSSLRRFVDGLIPGCYERVLLGSQESCSAELALLKHISIDASSENTEALDTAASAVVTKLARSERDEALTSTQLLGLLLLLRSNISIASVDVSLLLVLVRSGLLTLTAASDSDSWFQEFEATILLVESAVGSLKRQAQDKQLSALKMVASLLTEARGVVRETLLRLVGNDTSAVDFDFVAHLEAVVQHPCFALTLQNVDDDHVRLRVVRVVARLARITDKYTRSLLQTLLSCYSMSLSRFDRSLRVLFEEFETQRSKEEELTLVSMGFRFGASSTVLPSTAALKRSHNDLVDDSAWVLGGGLEQNRVRATIEHFPLDRKFRRLLDEEIATELDDMEQSLETDEKQAEAYDPAFLLPMLSHLSPHQTCLLGVAIRATSSDVEKIREYAFGILAHLHESLQATTETTSEFKAGRQVHLLLDVFRRGVEEPLEQVPSMITVFLNDALAVSPVRRTCSMDLADVPMFYSLFNSRAPLTFRQERSWLLHTLRRGVRSDDDVALLERRHVLPMLFSFFTSELADTHTQPLITNILLAALRTPSGGVYLVTKIALLEWLAAQFLRYGTSSKSSGSMKAASSALLLPLMTLLEKALQDGVWDELDATQQHATALQAANAFTAMQAAVATRRAGSSNDRLVTNKAAVVAALVVRRAGSMSSLEVLHKAVEVVQKSTQVGSALDCAEIVASSLTRWLLQQRHHEAQKHRFSDWAALLRQVASILVDGNSTTVMAQQQRARRALEQLKTVLDQLPTLKQLVVVVASSTADLQIAYAPALL
ncbi:Nucleolar pre-ribosomal-associated protein 1, C-terminal domain [Phytophthora cactorum]|nr:Nucleolar pre-ribosomal-associated protein 1, C-terminal domain [Phytophthora cactorum]